MNLSIQKKRLNNDIINKHCGLVRYLNSSNNMETCLLVKKMTSVVSEYVSRATLGFYFSIFRICTNQLSLFESWENLCP